MNLNIEKIFSNLKVHTVIDGYIIASNGSTLYGVNHKDNVTRKINKIPGQSIKGIFSRNRFISRGCRLGIHQIRKIFDDLVLIFCNWRLICTDTNFSKFNVIDIPNRCFQLMDHSICNTGNYVYFGEYFPNNARDSVNIYRSGDGNYWNKIYSFPRRSIKHIHVLQEDPFEKKIWFSTGDSDEESTVGFADYDFSDVTIVGKGNQTWRTLEFLFEKDKVYWGMDTPLENSCLIEYDRRSNKINHIGRFDGPIYNIKKTSLGLYLIGTAAEGGRGELDNNAHIWLSKDLKKWEDSISYAKDAYPYKMGLGRILFPDILKKKVIYSGNGLKLIDKKLVVGDVT